MRKLNMWQRLGIVLSVLWIVGAGFWQRWSDVERAGNFMSLSYRICTEEAAGKKDYNFAPCSDKADRDFAIYMTGSWGNVAVTALAPVVLGWIVAYVVLWVCRWVLAGRRISDGR